MRTVCIALSASLLSSALPGEVAAQAMIRATRATVGCASNAQLSTIARLRREGRFDHADAFAQRAIGEALCRAIAPGERLPVSSLHRDASYGDFYVHPGSAPGAALYVRAADFDLVESMAERN